MSDQIYAWFNGLVRAEQIAADKNYAIEEGGSILSVNLKELLDSTAVQKALRVTIPGVSCYSFGELWDMEFKDILNMLKKVSLSPSMDEITSYDKDLSHIVYDAGNVVRAVILVSVHSDYYHVDMLFGSTKQSQYIMTAAQRFVIAAQKKSAQAENIRVSMLASNKVLMPILERVLDKGARIDEAGKARYVRLKEKDKELSKAVTEAENTSPFQRNIAWKVPWELKVWGEKDSAGGEAGRRFIDNNKLC